MSEFRMPSLGADMEAGTLVEWRVEPGDEVHRGDIVAVVETDKGAIEIEIFEDGKVERIAVPVGQRVAVGAVLATLTGGKAAEPAPAAAPARRGRKPAAKTVNTEPPPPLPERPAATPPLPGAPRVRASPAARRLSSEQDVDLSTLSGSGPASAVTLQDVERALKAHGEEPTRVVEPASKQAPKPGVRRAIAAAMTRSNREIPHYYVLLDLDASPLLAWLEAENRKRTVVDRLLPLAPIVKAAALALRDFPTLVGQYDGETLAESGLHIGVAIALRDGGLIAPAIHDADQLSVGEIMARLRDLTNRARKGGLKSSEMADPAFTITSLGELSADKVLPLVFPPQVAILGLGSVARKPWVEGRRVVSRPVLTATLGADHRVSDGRVGGGFLNAFAHSLKEPEKL